MRKIKIITTLAMLSAISIILRQLEFPLMFLAPDFLKLDFSDLPVLISGFAFGPWAATAVALAKNLIALLITKTNGAGELANFIIAVALAVPPSIICRRMHKRSGAIIGLAAGSITMIAVSAPLNAFFLLPFFAFLYHLSMDTLVSFFSAINPAVDSVWTAILFCIIPFNIIKSLLISLITLLIYKRLSPIIRKFAN